ncbi:hypothetical protein J1N35_022480, partial [Gossypium stocksii]
MGWVWKDEPKPLNPPLAMAIIALPERPKKSSLESSFESARKLKKFLENALE